jgi:hypothetical protein
VESACVRRIEHDRTRVAAYEADRHHRTTTLAKPDDEMDLRLFEILAKIRGARTSVRSCGAKGKSFSSGRRLSGRRRSGWHQLMTRGHWHPAKFDLDVPVGMRLDDRGTFQRTLLCDVGSPPRRSLHAAGADPRRGPDTGSIACLFQMCGHGIVSDMV